MTFQLENIAITLTKEGKSVRLTTSTDNLLLARQTFEETKRVIKHNFTIVKNFYQQRANDTLKADDLNKACLKIVLRFFYMHNQWRSAGKNIKNESLIFLEEDLEHPYSFDEIIAVLKDQYPRNYTGKCQPLLNMNAIQFKKYEKGRRDFFNMRR